MLIAAALLAAAAVPPPAATAAPATIHPVAVHRAAFRDRAAMVLIDAGNGTWAAFNPRTASLDCVWQGTVDWRGKVFDFSQDTSRPKGRIMRDRMKPLATLPDATLQPGQTASLRLAPVERDYNFHSLLVAFDEQGRTPVTVRALEADGSERVRFSSCTHVSSDTEWQWNFKQLHGPSVPFVVEWTNQGAAPKPLRNLRIEGEQVAWTDASGRALAITWRGYQLATDAVTLNFDVAARDGTVAHVQHRVSPDAAGIHVETTGIPALLAWRCALADDPRSVHIGSER